MGLVGYYRQFVEGFLKIAKLIMKLQKKNKKFLWTKKCIESFQRLKDLLMMTLILKVPDMENEFLVLIDASKEVLGRFLM
jgi:hypothetical protein